MSPGEQLALNDANEFIRQTANLLDESEQSTGIRPHPVIEESETVLETTRFGMQFAPEPLAESEPGSGAPIPTTPTGACCADDGTCTVTTEADCTGTYQGDGTDCDPNPCPCCNRDITEISFVTLTGNFHGTTTGGCDDSASDTRTWTRINYADAFDGSDQFKFWIDVGCGINVEFSGAHLSGGLPQIAYSIGAFSNGGVTVLAFNVSALNCHLQYIVSASTCIVGSCNSTLTQPNIPVTTCDLSPIIGIYSTSNSCDGGPANWHTDVAATVTIS